MKLIEIEGVGEKFAKALGKIGLELIEDLKEKTGKQLKEIAEKAKISLKLVDKWAEMADLMGIKGIGPEYAEVLNKIGIDSVKELARRNAENTLKKIKEFDKKLPDVIRKLPTLDLIKEWIKAAKPVIEKKLAAITPGMGPKIPVIDIEGIGVEYVKDLGKAAIKYVEDLLGKGKKELEEIAKKSGISIKLIDKWQEHGDLMRIKGVGPEYAEALNEIGIDSVKEFAQRNVKNTLDKIVALDKEKPNIIRRLPTLEDIEDWIKEAKEIK